MGLTTNYGFTTLESSDTAGHTSINTCLQSIDNVLENKVNVAGMIMIFDTTTNNDGSVPSGWANLGNGSAIANTPLPILSGNYVYIRKA